MQCYPHSYGLELSTIRAAAARHDLEALNLIPEALIVSGIGQEDQPLLANVGVRVLAIFAGAEYARLFSVHNDLQVCVGRVPGSAYSRGTTFLSDTLILHDVQNPRNISA
jgi:hypothetical protein